MAPATTYETRLVRLAFLAPDLQSDILAGRISVGITLKQLLVDEMPLAWPDQRSWMARL